MNTDPFTRDEALHLWSRLVAGWAESLDASGARTLFAGHVNAADAGGSYEGVTRMLWGLGAWLSHPGRPAALRWRGAAYDLEALTRRALVAGTDPRSPGYWGRAPNRGEYDQRTVESGEVAFAAWQSRARVWALMSPEEREHLVAWLERFGRKPSTWRNNWALFWALNHAARKALGVRHEQAVIDSALDYLEGVACEGGWYDDAAARGEGKFEDYNWWVFTTHELAWGECDGHTQQGRYELLCDRIRQRMQHYPFLFAASGAYAEYGRSLSYKFARLGGPLMAYRHGCWPHSAGLLRRLVGRHMRWYVDRGAIRRDGTLRQALTADGNPAVRETYISTGATYWAMLAFAGLWALSDDDPFWMAEEEPLPAEQGDFARALPTPGWLLVGSQGEVQRFNAGSSGYYPAKYGKFVYSTSAPFNVGLADGLPGPDSMLCLTDGEGLGHRLSTDAFAVGGERDGGWARMRHRQQVGGGTHAIDTAIFVRGALHVRAHRVTLDPAARGPLGALEGCAPLGYPPGEHPQIAGDAAAGWELAAAGGRAVAIARLRGYDGQRRAAAWRGRPDLNSVYAEHVLPLLSVSRLEPAHELVCLVYDGAAPADPSALLAEVAEVTWDPGGACRVRWADGSEVVAPPLP